MVLLSKTQTFLMNKSYEECLMFLTDIVKNNFSFLLQERGFSFKAEIGRFRDVNKENMLIQKREYEIIFQKQEEYWRFFNSLQRDQKNK